MNDKHPKRERADLEAKLDEYLAGYTLEGDDGFHTPTELELLIAKDVVMGLLVEPWFASGVVPILRNYGHGDPIGFVKADGNRLLVTIEGGIPSSAFFEVFGAVGYRILRSTIVETELLVNEAEILCFSVRTRPAWPFPGGEAPSPSSQARQFAAALAGEPPTLNKRAARTDHPMAVVVDEFNKARESCRFYTGIKERDGSKQCKHKDAGAGDWCAMDCCPLLRQRAEWAGIGWN